MKQSPIARYLGCPRVTQETVSLAWGDATIGAMGAADVAKILALPAEERLRLVELICESLAAKPCDVPLSDAHRAVLDERLAEHERTPNDVVTRAEVFAFARRS